MTNQLKHPLVVSVVVVVTVVLFFEGAAGLAVLALLVPWWWFLYKYQSSGGRRWNPFPVAITTTVAAGLFLVAGTVGYTLSRHDRMLDGTAWADGVIWWEVGVGLALLLLAASLWRSGLRSVASSARAH